MSDNIAGDYHTCKIAADQFFYVSNLCNSNNVYDYLNKTFYPYSVNVSFTCELYLKAIMIYRSPNDEFCKGHDLKVLFSHLPQNDAVEIENRFNSFFNNKKLSDFLNENGNVFVEWRYALENTVKIDVTGFETFSSVLNNYVKELDKIV